MVSFFLYATDSYAGGRLGSGYGKGEPKLVLGILASIVAAGAVNAINKNFSEFLPTLGGLMLAAILSNWSALLLVRVGFISEQYILNIMALILLAILFAPILVLWLRHKK